MTILFKTIHGSRLYGLDHPESDYDWFTVVDGQYKTTHKVDKETGQDETVVSFNTFVREAISGAPKALEAMFSTKAEVDLIGDYRANFLAGHRYDTYKGIMKRVALTEKYDDDKHRRLILRLAWNLNSLRLWGRFDPTLKPRTAEAIKAKAAEWSMEDTYRRALRLAEPWVDGVDLDVYPRR